MSGFLNFILIVGLACTVIYLAYFKKPDSNITYNTTIQQEESIRIEHEQPIRRLSGFVDAHLDQIFSPLSDKDSVMPSQEISQIRATLADLSITNDQRDRRLYFSGITLCDQLLRAIAFRETYGRRLADSLTKRPISLEMTQQRREEDIERKWRFFHDSILRSWETDSRPLHEQIRKQYDYMRLLER